MVMSDRQESVLLSEEELRRELTALARKNKCFSAAAVIAFVVAAAMILLGFTQGISLLLCVPFIVVGGVFLCLNNATRRKLKGYLSSHIVYGVLNEVFELKTYQPNAGISGSVIRSAGLIDTWDRVQGSDYVEGKYRNLDVCFSDVHLEKEEVHVDSKGHTTTSWVTKFKGLWLTCRLNRPIPYKLRIRENAERMLLGGYAKSRSDVETENIEFNQKFQILTSDPHTAFYVLTPHFMEYIVSADRSAQGRMYLCFSGDVVHIAIHTNQDAFELKAGENVADLDGVRARVRSEVKYVTDILDELRKNEYLFSEE